MDTTATRHGLPTRRDAIVEIPPARPSDLDDLAALLRSVQHGEPPPAVPRRNRFRGAPRDRADRHLVGRAPLLGGARSRRPEDPAAIVGAATLAWGTAGEVEVAFLVEDGWMRHGVGRLLFGAMALHAAAEGIESLLARVQGGNERARRFLRSVAPGARTRFVGSGEFEVDLPVRPAAALAAGRPILRETA